MNIAAATVESAGLLAPPWRALTTGIVALISLIGFEYLAIATAMPAVARALDGLPLYTLAFGGPLAAAVIGMVLSGGWSDHHGPRPVLGGGIAAFVAGLLLAGAADSMPLLVVARLVQGFGGGLLSVALYVIVARAYPASLHPRIFAAFAAAWVVPVVVGPALAGRIVGLLGWRWVFFGAALLAVPAALLVWAGLLGRPLPHPAVAARRDPRRLPWAIGAASCAGLLYWAGRQQGTAVLVLLPAMLGLLWFAGLLLPAGSLRARRGLPSVIALRGLAAAAFCSGEVFIPLLLSRERGLTLTQAGLVLTVGALGWSAASWWQARPERPQATALLRCGMTLIGGGIAAVTLLAAPAVPLAFGIAGWAVAGFGMGLVCPTLSVLALALSPAAQQGAGSAALQLGDALFSTAVLALSGALSAAVGVRMPAAACVAGLVPAALLALLGAAASGRVRPGVVAGPTNE